MVVGEPEQVRGALARLDVLEGDVVDCFSPSRVRVLEVAQHLLGATGGCRSRARSRRAPASASSALPLRVVAAWRSRASCRRGCSRAAARAGPSRGRRRSARGWSPGRRRRRSRPSRSRSRAAASQAVDLDVVDLVAALVARRGVGGHVREALDRAPQRRSRSSATPELELDACGTRCSALAVVGDRVAEAVRARCGPERSGRGRCRRRSAARRRRSARPRRPGRRSRRSAPGRPRRGRWSTRPARPRCRGRRAIMRADCAAHERAPVVGLADRDVAGATGSPAPSRPPARRRCSAGSASTRPRRSRRAARSPATVGGVEEQVVAERHRLPEQRRPRRRSPRARRGTGAPRSTRGTRAGSSWATTPSTRAAVDRRRAQLNSPPSTRSGAPTISTGSRSRLASTMLRQRRRAPRRCSACWCSRSSIAYAESPSSGKTTSAACVLGRLPRRAPSVRSTLKAGSAGRRCGTAAATRANPWL